MTLEERVIQLLKAKGSTLALAEVGTGGSLSAALSAVTDANQVLVGSFSAPSNERLRVLLGVSGAQWQVCTTHKQKTGRLAVGVTRITNSQWAVSVGEPLQEEKEYHTMAIAIKQPGGQWESMQIQARGSGQWVHDRLVTNILDQLRRRLN
jgi:nicotinamide-nucleotide amidase